jgi:uncharacterized repeat protein (TIGR01451 family)
MTDTIKTHLSILGLAFLAACGGGLSEDTATSGHALTVSSPPPFPISISSSAPLVQGIDDTYTVTVTNDGQSAVTQVGVGIDFDGASLRGVPATCAKLGGGTSLVNCQVATLAAGASLILVFDINPIAAGPITFGAAACATGVTFCSTVTDSETVAPGSTDLQITGSSNQGSPPLNSQFTYTFQVKNNGPFATSGGVSFADALPPALTFVGVTTSVGSCTGGASVSCALGDLAVGAQATIQITVIAPSTAQTIVNTSSANLAPGQTDKNPTNNTVSVTVTSK